MNRLHHPMCHPCARYVITMDSIRSAIIRVGFLTSLAPAVSKSIIFCFIFFCSLVDEFSTYGGLAFSTILINVFVRIWITDQTYYHFQINITNYNTLKRINTSCASPRGVRRPTYPPRTNQPGIHADFVLGEQHSSFSTLYLNLVIC